MTRPESFDIFFETVEGEELSSFIECWSVPRVGEKVCIWVDPELEDEERDVYVVADVFWSIIKRDVDKGDDICYVKIKVRKT